MSSDKDSRPWITIFPDYPRAFAWHRKAVDEDCLDSYVGAICGEIGVDDTVRFEDDVIQDGLAGRIKEWLGHWLGIEDRLIASPDEKSYDEIMKDGKAVDNEGLEIAREMKRRYGAKFRFRYSRAWEHGDKDWVVI
ncbi:MAG: hypothetical protein ACI4Q3_03130 [Kiritimatiellia bacterium]